MSHIGCIVMASGASTRFGSNKLMASFMGKPLIQHVIETAQTAGLEPIVVTIDDPFHEPILALCNKLKVRAVRTQVPFKVTQYVEQCLRYKKMVLVRTHGMASCFYREINRV